MTRKELEKLLEDNFSEDEEMVFKYYDNRWGAPHYSYGCCIQGEKDGWKTIVVDEGYGTATEKD